MKKRYKTIFLDRDGTLNIDPGYISKLEYFKFYDFTFDALKLFDDIGCNFCIITNQSGIARGLFKWHDYEKVTFKMLEMLGTSCLIDGIYANSLEPLEKLPRNSWRKPNPNMIIKASQDFNIDLSKSFLIGDRLSDIQAGYKAGLKNLIHVLTGHGKDERKKVIENYIKVNDNLNLKLINDLSYLNKIVF